MLSFQVSVPVPHFYAPVTDLLLPLNQEWEGMRTVGRLRFEMGLKPPMKMNSLYKVTTFFKIFLAIFFNLGELLREHFCFANYDLFSAS